MLDNAWLDGALELHKKMKEMADHSWHFDKSWLDKAMEMQKMITGPGINSKWYQELLDSAMKGYPGSGFFSAQESDSQPDAAVVEHSSSNHRPPSGGWQPQFTITETGSQVTLTSYIPGIKDKEDVSIRLDGGNLIISGRNMRFSGGQDGQDGRIEEFYREIRLPSDVRGDGTAAYYANGSLTIKIPKSKPASIDLHFSQ